MAKKVELKERGTNEIMYPVTLAECVLNLNGTGLDEDIEDLKEQLSWRVLRTEPSGIGIMLKDGTIIDMAYPFIKEAYSRDEVEAITLEKDDVSIAISLNLTSCYFCGGGVVCPLASQYETATIASVLDTDGENNTTIFRQVITNSGNAVGVAYNTYINGLHCYLPALAELRIIMKYKDEINELLTKCDGDTISAHAYWSSSLAMRKNSDGEGTNNPNDVLDAMYGYYGSGSWDGFNVQGLYKALPITKLNK